ncbi:MAG: response regulator [Candidatus Kaiserbacteria bacterium]|nr:response regulator [Candidatus Kaiserbacteria bacterium]MCB9816157.1 response regulator [Candidatus Nomurabacteria bacterium]
MKQTPKKILIIEDESMLLEALSENFTELGYVVTGCPDAQTAFDHMQEDKPDIILTDLVLPNIDGFEILRTLQQSVHLSDIPVLVLSNLAEPTDIKKAKDLGAHDFLVKAQMALSEIVERVEKELETGDKKEK